MQKSQSTIVDGATQASGAEVLAIIPARGGSKGLPGKNMLDLAGHPLIAWSIAAAQACPLVTRIIVSTDDPAIAEIAKSYGAEVPFMRPAAYAQDLSTDLEVFTHALIWLSYNQHYLPELVVQLRPTSPVRPAGLLAAAIEKLRANQMADSLRIVTDPPATPYKMWTLPEGEGSPMLPILTVPGVAEPYNMPRQMLPRVYWQIGLLDVIRAGVILAGSMSGAAILPMVVLTSLAIDIDTAADFERARVAILANEVPIPKLCHV